MIERGDALVAVELKATSAPRARDIAHLRTFREEYGDAVRGCLLLHGGDRVEPLAPRILAVPWWRVL